MYRAITRPKIFNVLRQKHNQDYEQLAKNPPETVSQSGDASRNNQRSDISNPDPLEGTQFVHNDPGSIFDLYQTDAAFFSAGFEAEESVNSLHSPTDEMYDFPFLNSINSAGLASSQIPSRDSLFFPPTAVFSTTTCFDISNSDMRTEEFQYFRSVESLPALEVIQDW